MKNNVALAALLCAAISNTPVQASYTMTLTESGGNVVASGSGTLNTTALTSNGSTPTFPAIAPISGFMAFGTMPPGSADRYIGLITGPTNFGTGAFNASLSGTGSSVVGMSQIPNTLLVPQGYVSNTVLTYSGTAAGQTFSSLGVTPGTYTWTWGSGGDADSFVLQIGAASNGASNVNAVPTLSEWGLILLSSLLALGTIAYTRRQRS